MKNSTVETLIGAAVVLIAAGFFFFADTPKGPPFGTNMLELDGLLQPQFERVDDRPVADSIQVFAGKERWQVWKKP